MEEHRRQKGGRRQGQAPAGAEVPAPAGTGAPAPAQDTPAPATGTAPGPGGTSRPSPLPQASKNQVAIVCVALVLIAAIVAFSIFMMRSTSTSLASRQQVESQLDYLVGTSAVTAYWSLNGYPVTFVEPDDGNPLGTWTAQDDGAAGQASSSADGAAGTGAGTTTGTHGVSAQIDVTYQVQEAANNDYALDDDRYTVIGHSSPDATTGQITVIVQERFRALEEELSRTIDIDHVASALQEWGAANCGEGFELAYVRATSIDSDSGTWVVEGGARADLGDGEGAQDLDFAARVNGTNDSPNVAQFDVMR